MTTDRPRRLAAATLVLAAATGLAGCHTGFDAATGKQYQPGIGAVQREGDVRLYNVLLVENADGTFSLSAGIVNTTDDEQALNSATFAPLTVDEGSQGAPTSVETEGDVSVPAGGRLTLGPEGELAGLEIEGTGEGRYVTVTLTFEGSGEVAVEAPVVQRTAEYSGIPEESAAAAAERAAEEAAAEEEATEGQLAEEEAVAEDAPAE